MTLTLTIRDLARLPNGSSGELVLHRRGAIVGRAPTCDWTLPDPIKHISSRHFEISFDGRDYLLTDTSTNGTFLNGSPQRLVAPHRISRGDRFQVGPFVIHAMLSGEADAPSEQSAGEPRWSGWGADNDAASHPSSGRGDWDAVPSPLPENRGARWEPALGPGLARPEAHRGYELPSARSSENTSSGWAPVAAAPVLPTASAWEAPTPATDSASGWSSAAPDRPAAPSPDDVWGRLAEGNVVNWARGGFGQPVARDTDPLGLNPPPAQAALPVQRPTPPQPPADPEPANGPANAQRSIAIMRKLVAGLVLMVEARARAKAQLGAESTAFNPAGHNPLKFARTPEEAMAMLLEEPHRGFMDAEQAVEDAFRELQSHQMASLRAMQGALRATLDRFSPSAIRARADAVGVLERILPAARDAALWQAYEREFAGVAQGSDEAFMDVFAKEFRVAYNDQVRRGG